MKTCTDFKNKIFKPSNNHKYETVFCGYLGPMPLTKEISNVYGFHQDLLSFCNCYLYYQNNLCSLSTLSHPNFYKSEVFKTSIDSYTILVNRYLPKTFSKLGLYYDYFNRFNVQNIIIIENTSIPDITPEGKLSHLKPEDLSEIANRIEDYQYSFPELENFKELIPGIRHIQVEEVSINSINQVFNAILSVSKGFKATKPENLKDLLTLDEVMDKHQNSQLFYTSKTNNQDVELDV